jgi:precorrin-4/cobalt-precorrin-4 C11-methyltransferase
MSKSKFKNKCQVFFIGAGPGDPELMTIKGEKCIKRADLVLYAGSLVPQKVVERSKKGAKIVDSSSMTLEETHTLMVETVKSGGIVARVHTGDPSLYGAVKEQMVLLDREGIDYEVIPGVTVAFAAAAAAKISFTLPEKTQTLIFTRLAGRTPVPELEQLRDLAGHKTSLAIYLSVSHTAQIVEELFLAGYTKDTPIILAYRVGWPDELILTSPLSELVQTVEEHDIRRQAVFLVLPGQDDENTFSKLYSSEFEHGFRKGGP